MAEINKIEFLIALETKVKKHLQDANEIFLNGSESMLLQPSVSGGWSIAQCLDHLNSYGHYYLPHIKKNLTSFKSESKDGNFETSFLGNYFTRMMEPTTGKKKFKAFKGHIPSIDLDAYEVIEEFIAQQEELLQYLLLARNVNLNKIKIPISISRFIKLSLGDVFQFIIAHNERHVVQAKRNVHLITI